METQSDLQQHRGFDLAKMGWTAVAGCEEVYAYKSHRERNVAQHFILCDNSQNCYRHHQWPFLPLFSVQSAAVKRNALSYGSRWCRRWGDLAGFSASFWHSIRNLFGGGALVSGNLAQKLPSCVSSRPIWACWLSVLSQPFGGFPWTRLESPCFSGYTFYEVPGLNQLEGKNQSESVLCRQLKYSE